MRKRILTLVLLISSLTAFAQGEQTSKRYITNDFSDNWFITIGGGINKYLGENDMKALLLGPSVDLSVGKWVSPTFGLRLQATGFKAFGATTPSVGGSFNTGKAISGHDGYTKEAFYFLNLHGDVMWDITSELYGFDADRLWSFIPYAGFGGIVGMNVDDTNKKDYELAFSAGLINKFRLTEAIDLDWEIRGMLVNQRFDGVVAGRKIEGMVATTIGLTYNFAKRDFDEYVYVEPANYAPYNQKISDLEKQLSDKDAEAQRLAKELADMKNKPAEKATTEYVTSPLAVFFQINKAELTDKEIINLGYVADVIKQSGKKFQILGSADKATGTPAWNKKLSEKRAQKVYDVLVNKFGVSADQLEVVAKGSENEPFGKPVLNRVVVVE